MKNLSLNIQFPSTTKKLLNFFFRSRLALQHLDIGGGVIDSDYRGNIAVIMINHGKNDYSIKTGDRIAQLLIIKCCTPKVIQTEVKTY